MERQRPYIHQRPHTIYEAQRAKTRVEQPKPTIAHKVPETAPELPREAYEHHLGSLVMSGAIDCVQAYRLLQAQSEAQA